MLLLEVSALSPLNSSFRGTSVTMATTTEPSLGNPYSGEGMVQLAGDGSATLSEYSPLVFAFLWRMVDWTRSQPEVRLRWRLLYSSLNHAPDRKRRRVGSVTVSSRTLQHQDKHSQL